MIYPSAPEVKRKVTGALGSLFHHDIYLLQFDVNERSISHRLATYLQREFADWDVDCEYNRNHDVRKQLDISQKNVRTDDTQAKTVFPDIIVHHRKTDENLLVIEIKKTSNTESDCFDLKKLRAFKSQLRYRYALFLRLKTGTIEVGVRKEQWIDG
jgi:hypothetical protein